MSTISQQFEIVAQSSRRMGAKPIKGDVRPKARRLLHNFRAREQLEGEAFPTSIESSAPFLSSQGTLTSAASRTNPLDQSDSSIATSVKEFTMVWSVNNGSEQKEQERRCLTPAMRARKALVRLLGACEEGCRDRRVKCYLSHHSLEDLLDGDCNDLDRENVRWALEIDSDPNQELTLSTINLTSQIAPTATESVIDRVSRVLDIPSPPQAMYEQRLSDFDEVQDQANDKSYQGPNNSLQVEYIISEYYSTFKSPEMFPIGVRVDDYENNGLISQHYQCLFMGVCPNTYPSHQDLCYHYSYEHMQLHLIADPLRLVCASCYTFYPGPTGFCSSPSCPQHMALLENVFAEFPQNFHLQKHSTGKGVEAFRHCG